MRPKTLSIVPIAMMLMLAAGTMGVSAATGNAEAAVAVPSIGSGAAAVVRVPVNLGTAGNFAILTKSGVTDVYASTVNGNVGTSPISGTAMLLRCTEVTGTIYTVDPAGPLPCRVTPPGGQCLISLIWAPGRLVG